MHLPHDRTNKQRINRLICLVTFEYWSVSIFLHFYKVQERPLPCYGKFERSLFLSCMLWSQAVHVAGPYLLRNECTWGIAIPPGLNVCPFQVPLLPLLPWTNC